MNDKDNKWVAEQLSIIKGCYRQNDIAGTLSWWKTHGLIWNIQTDERLIFDFLLNIYDQPYPLGEKTQRLQDISNLSSDESNEIVSLKSDTLHFGTEYSEKNNIWLGYIVVHSVLSAIKNKAEINQAEFYYDRIPQSSQPAAETKMQSLVSCLDYFESEWRKKITHLDGIRGDICYQLSSCHYDFQAYDEAKIAANNALSYFANEYCKENIEYDIPRVVAAYNLSLTYSELQDYKNELDSLQRTLSYLDSQSCQNDPMFDKTRAEVWHFVGVNYSKSENIEQSKSAYFKAISYYDRDGCRSMYELDDDRASTWFNIGQCFKKTENHRDATNAYVKALEYIDGEYCKSNVQHDLIRSRIWYGLAFVHKKTNYKDNTRIAYCKALLYLEGKYCKETPHLDTARAEVSRDLGDFFYDIETWKKAKRTYLKALVYYNTEYSRNQNNLDGNKGYISFKLGKCYQQLDDNPAAKEAYIQSLSYLESPDCRRLESLDDFRGFVWQNLGVVYRDINSNDQAVMAFKNALTYYDGDYCGSNIKLDEERADTWAGICVIYEKMFDHAKLNTSTIKALQYYEGDYCSSNIKLDKERGDAWLTLGISFLKLNIHENLESYCFKALSYYNGSYCKNNPELDEYRGSVLILAAESYIHRSLYSNAQKAIINSLKYYDGDHCSLNIKFDYQRGQCWLNLGVCYRKLNLEEKAINSYNKALSYFEGVYCQTMIDTDKERFNVWRRIGLIYKNIGDLHHSKKTFIKALSFLNSTECMKFDELDSERADTWEQIGNILQLCHDLPDAEVAFKKSIAFFEGPHCSKNKLFDVDRGRLWEKVGFIYCKQNSIPDAQEAYNKAAEYFRRSCVVHSLPYCEHQSRHYANTIVLLHHWDDPISWACKRSEHMIEMIELAPVKEDDPDSEQLWTKIRQHFSSFHGSWLKYSLEQRHFDQVIQILLAIQGRELVQEIMDDVVAHHSRCNQPETVQLYLDLRRQLREMISQQRVHITDHSPVLKKILHQESMSTDQTAKSTDSPPVLTKVSYCDLRAKMKQARALAADEPGYGALGNFDIPNTDELLSLTPFKSHQGLVFLIDLQHCCCVLIISKNGDTHWMGGAFIDEFILRLNRLIQTQRNDNTQRGCSVLRHNISSFLHMEKHEQDLAIFTQKEKLSFWRDFVCDFETKFWAPLSLFIEEHKLTELMILPHGRWHQLPFSAGSPDKITLRYYPGLVHYGLKTGLLPGSISTPNDITETCPFGVVAYNATDHINTNLALENVDTEIKELQALPTPAVLLNTPDDFPSKAVSIRMFHYAGHCDVDPHDNSSTALLVGYDHENKRNNYLGMYDVAIGNTVIEHAFINGCSTGLIRENVQGNPSGIAIALQRRTESLTTPLYPITDDLACVMAIFYHRCWQKVNQKQIMDIYAAQTVLYKTLDHLLDVYQLVRFKAKLIHQVKEDIGNYDQISASSIQKLMRELNQPQAKKQLQTGLQSLTSLMSDEQIDAHINSIIDQCEQAGEFGKETAPNLPDDLGMFYYGYRLYG